MPLLNGVDMRMNENQRVAQKNVESLTTTPAGNDDAPDLHDFDTHLKALAGECSNLKAMHKPEDYDQLIESHARANVSLRMIYGDLLVVNSVLARQERLLELLDSSDDLVAPKTKQEILSFLRASVDTMSKSFVSGASAERSGRAKANARARYSKDPKQAAKLSCKADWDEWKAGITSYTGDTAFARMCLDAYPVLTSEAVVTGWCRKWEKERMQAAE